MNNNSDRTLHNDVEMDRGYFTAKNRGIQGRDLDTFQDILDDVYDIAESNNLYLNYSIIDRLIEDFKVWIKNQQNKDFIRINVTYSYNNGFELN